MKSIKLEHPSTAVVFNECNRCRVNQANAMYRPYYHLRLSPFKVEPDPEFLWLGEKHLEGLSTLQYAIRENKGFLLLLGDAGTGKTVLIHQLRKSLPPHIRVAFIQDPGIETLDLYRILSSEFKIGGRFEGKADFLARFKKFLYVTYALHQQLLVIIDEAHRLSHELLDEIRVLSNIDFENKNPINIFFVGQGEFERLLMDERNQAARQRIAVSYRLSPLDARETRAYIQHRLKIAGSEKDLFSPEAAWEIHRMSSGTPRLINIICDRALLTGFIRDLEQIGPEIIRECAGELDVPLGVSVPADEEAPEIPTKPEEPGPAANLSKKPFRWRIAAAAVTLAVLVYLSFSSVPPEDARPREPAVTGDQPLSGRMSTPPPPLGEPTPEPSEETTARKPPALPGRDSASASVEGREAAGSLKEAIDRPVAVERKRDPWEKMPVEKIESAKLEEEKVTSGMPETSKATGPEIVPATQNPAVNVQRFYIFFRPGSAELENASFEVLSQVSQLLLTHPDSRITLSLFPPGSKARKGYRVKLSTLRTNGVKSFFASRGLGARLTVSENLPAGLPAGTQPPKNTTSESWAEICLETGAGR
jgi:general secretion pathway protein A